MVIASRCGKLAVPGVLLWLLAATIVAVPAEAQLSAPLGQNTKGARIGTSAQNAALKREYRDLKAQEKSIRRERDGFAKEEATYRSAASDATARGDGRNAWLYDSNARLARLKKESAEQRLAPVTSRLQDLKNDLRPIIAKEKRGKQMRRLPKLLKESQQQLDRMNGNSGGGWRCNAYGTIHPGGPSECDKPEDGGSWVNDRGLPRGATP